MILEAPKEGPMSESYRSTEESWSVAGSGGNGYQGAAFDRAQLPSQGEAGKALLVGILGGLLSAAGYLIYRRLPDEQKDRINSQVRAVVQQRITEIRENLNI
jgi:hypothetical protein